MGTVTSITIDMDAKCDECGKGGRCGNGLCLPCTTKAMGDKPMKSATGRAVRERFRASIPHRSNDTLQGSPAAQRKEMP